jgi:hypothetical protein
MADENPYKLRGMIPIDSNMFFGREREMKRIAGMLPGETPQCVSIIGERRIGKSSLANRVFHGLRTMDDTRAVYLDCDLLPDDCLSKDQFFQFLNQKFLESEVEAPAPQPGSRMPLEKDQKNLFADYPSFKAFISDTGRKGIKTVIFLDEFEHLPCEEKKNKHPFADDTFFSNLRAIANDPANRLAFEQILKMTGGQPYLVQLLCRTLVNNLNDSKKRNDAVIDDVDEAVEEIITGGTDRFSQQIWDDAKPLERLLLSAAAGEMTRRQLDFIGLETLCGQVEGVAKAFTRKQMLEALDKLVSREILEEEEMRYRFPVNLLRKWLAARFPLRKVREEI